jgi:hypothetical protein
VTGSKAASDKEGNVPTFMIRGYKFQFYSLDQPEPPHVHVFRGGHAAKIWLNPVALVYNYGYNRPEINRILKLTRRHQAQLLEAWHEHFDQ